MKQLRLCTYFCKRWESWRRIDKAERTAGAKVGKPREKIVSVQEMLHVANGAGDNTL